MVEKSDLQDLMMLPDHLRKTQQSLNMLTMATAEEIAEKTGRARAVESSYLNQLHLQGRVSKERHGRTVYFSVADNSRWDDLFKQAKRLPFELQRILVDDLLEAFQNRLVVLVKSCRQ